MNINYGPFQGKPVALLLLEVVSGVFAKAPNLTFVAKSVDSNDNINCFSVYHDTEYVGGINILIKRRSDGARYTTIRVTSENIVRERGEANTKYTENPKVAVKVCLGSFRPTPQGKVADAIFKRAVDMRNVMGYRVNSNLTAPWAQSDKITQLIRCVLSFIDGNPVAPASVLKHLEDKKTAEALGHVDAVSHITNCFDTKHGVVLAAARGGAYHMVDLASPEVFKVIKDTYDLPPNYQEKLAILKIMEKMTPIQNVGFKFCDDAQFGDSFFLAGGDTIPAS